MLTALDALADAVTQNIARLERVVERVEEVRQQQSSGRASQISWSPQMRRCSLNWSARTWRSCVTGYQLRKAEAVALYNQGMIMERIAGLFGVSRQRVSARLRRDDAHNGVYQPDVDHQHSYRCPR